MGEVIHSLNDSAVFTTAAGLLIKQWPGEDTGVVFTTAERKTHLISPLAATILELSRSGNSVSGLLAQWTEPDAPTAQHAGQQVLFEDEYSSEEHSRNTLSEAVQGLIQAGLLRRLG